MTTTAAGDVPVLCWNGGTAAQRNDAVVTEEPLELRLRCGGETRRIAVTMRTPGADLELAAGFVLGEGIVDDPSEISSIAHCDDPALAPAERGNVVTIAARVGATATAALERHFTISSACGVCGTASIELLRSRGYAAAPTGGTIDADLLASLPERMRARQRLFETTGGLHAAALFDRSGTLLALREDVGRHNAVDKVIGWLALRRVARASDCVLVVSGRCSYEIVQKALAARIPIVAAVSAPTSLAVALAGAFDLTLVGFVRDRRWNCYAGGERIAR